MTHIIEKSENLSNKERKSQNLLFEVTVNIWVSDFQMAFLKNVTKNAELCHFPNCRLRQFCVPRLRQALCVESWGFSDAGLTPTFGMRGAWLTFSVP